MDHTLMYEILGVVEITNDAAITVPDGTTHFIFEATTRTNTHINIKIGGNAIAVAPGLVYPFHGKAKKPAIARVGTGSADVNKVVCLKVSAI